jgi:DNA-binding NarL/FixJ family response regulator
LTPKIILVADDNPMVRKAVCKTFETELDYELCAEATNGEEAIQRAKQCRPDLIILDLVMPIMNGIDAARELKRLMPQVPIILFTLYGDKAGNCLGLDSPIDLVLAKSNAANLMNHVRSLIPA